MGWWTSVNVGSPNPAAPRIASTVSWSASENGSRASGAGTGDPSRPSARSIATDHSLCSCSCQTIITRRPAGRSATAMLANAAMGSSKNIVPNRLMARSKPSSGKRCTCASPCSKATLWTLSARASSRARSIIDAERSTPSALPSPADRAASRVVRPVPQPTSRTRASRCSRWLVARGCWRSFASTEQDPMTAVSGEDDVRGRAVAVNDLHLSAELSTRDPGQQCRVKGRELQVLELRRRPWPWKVPVHRPDEPLALVVLQRQRLLPFLGDLVRPARSLRPEQLEYVGFLDQLGEPLMPILSGPRGHLVHEHIDPQRSVGLGDRLHDVVVFGRVGGEDASEEPGRRGCHALGPLLALTDAAHADR